MHVYLHVIKTARGYALLKCFSLPFCVFITVAMKGTKVLTLGAGREVLPHNVAVTKAAYIYTRPLAIRMRYMCIYACAVLLIGGRAGPIFDSWSLTSLLRVGHRVATQHAGVDTRPAVQFLAPPRYAELSR